MTGRREERDQIKPDFSISAFLNECTILNAQGSFGAQVGLSGKLGIVSASAQADAGTLRADIGTTGIRNGKVFSATQGISGGVSSPVFKNAPGDVSLNGGYTRSANLSFDRSPGDPSLSEADFAFSRDEGSFTVGAGAALIFGGSVEAGFTAPNQPNGGCS